LRLTIESDTGIGAAIRAELRDRLKNNRAMNSLRKEMEKAIDTSSQERDVRNAVRAAAVEWMRSVITGWQVDARAGKSIATKSYQREEMKKLEATMKEFLQVAIGQGKGLLGGVSFNIPEIEDHVLMGYQAGPMKTFKSRFDWILDHTDKVRFLRPLRDGY